MDTALLTGADFWSDPRPFAAREIPDVPELAHHVLFETSGSSGVPKWVALSKSALLASAAAVNDNLQVTAASCWGLALPLRHVGGFGVASRTFQAGCRIGSFPRKWDPHAFHRWLGETGVTHTSLVPTQVHDLVKQGLRAPAVLEAIVVGGGRLDAACGQAARDLGWPVLASYGMTEAGSQIATQGPDALESPYQMAPIPVLPIWQTRLDPGGLLEISGPALFSGYLTGNVFTPRASGWHTTSDRVELAGNAITPLGRADTLIKILGELVDPEEIERELVALSAGALAAGSFAVIALPDERAEHLLVPVFETGVDVPHDLLAAYQASAAGFMRLAAPRRIDRLPRTELGKLRRGELAAHFAAGA